MKKLLLIALPVVLAPTSGLVACASAPKAAADRPAMVIPPPPPRVVPITAEPVLEPVAEIPSTAGSSAPPAARQGRGPRDAVKSPAADSKPETKPEAAVAETPAPVSPPPPAGPPPQLRTAESPGTEATIRAQVDRARHTLNGVDYRTLNRDLRKAYDDAKRFADQADEALKQGNVVFAQGVAAKAETLARELAAR
jgi:hypothetical protein